MSPRRFLSFLDSSLGDQPTGNPRCRECGSVFFRGKWFPEQRIRSRRGVKRSGEVECPACRQQKENRALGVVELEGTALKAQKDNILNAIYRAEGKARVKNDQGRIVSIRKTRSAIKVYSTLPEVAQQIGQEVERLSSDLSVRVRWWPETFRVGEEPGLAQIQAKKKPSSTKKR